MRSPSNIILLKSMIDYIYTKNAINVTDSKDIWLQFKNDPAFCDCTRLLSSLHLMKLFNNTILKRCHRFDIDVYFDGDRSKMVYFKGHWSAKRTDQINRYIEEQQKLMIWPSVHKNMYQKELSEAMLQFVYDKDVMLEAKFGWFWERFKARYGHLCRGIDAAVFAVQFNNVILKDLSNYDAESEIEEHFVGMYMKEMEMFLNKLINPKYIKYKQVYYFSYLNNFFFYFLVFFVSVCHSGNTILFYENVLRISSVLRSFTQKL